MSKVNLSKKQKEVVVFEKGSLLVKAAAGSGKTRVLTERICSLAQKTKRKILVMMDNKEKQSLKIRALDAISWIKRDAVLDDQLEEYLGNDGEDLMSLYFAYRDILRSQNAIDFDDLLWYTYNLFITNHNIASLYSRSYEYICVDEAQDLNRVQYFVLRSMTFGRNNNIMLVGDPNQSIYGFNGSSADLMQKDFIKDYSPTIIIVLNGICEETRYDTVEQEAESVVKKISDLISLRNCDEIEGVISYTNFAILARNKYVLQAVENVLSSHNIPY